jgi:hypothetical protein
MFVAVTSAVGPYTNVGLVFARTTAEFEAADAPTIVRLTPP